MKLKNITKIFILSIMFIKTGGKIKWETIK